MLFVLVLNVCFCAVTVKRDQLNANERAGGVSRFGRALSRSMKSLIGAEKEETLVQVEMDSRSNNRKF